MLIEVLSLLTAFIGCEGLRLCESAEVQVENCLLDVQRLEIRQLDTIQRKHLLNAFRSEKAQHKRKEWERILEGDLAHDLIRRLDDRLSVEGFFTPYWDARIDRRLTKPEDSTLFHDDFLPRQPSRKERAARTSAKRKESHPLAEFRKTKNSQLLYVLYEVAKTRIHLNESCSTVCPLKSDWLFCDRLVDRCVATVSLGGNCTRKSRSIFAKICYKSECLAGRCSVTSQTTKPETSTAEKEAIKLDHKREHRKKGRSRQKAQRVTAMSTTTTSTTPATTTAEVEGSGTTDALEQLIDRADQILNAKTVEEPEKGERRRAFRDLFIKPLNEDVIGPQKLVDTEMEIALTMAPDVAANVVYSLPVADEAPRIEHLSTVIGLPPVLNKNEQKYLSENDDVPAALREESTTPYFQDVPITKVPISTRLPHKGPPMMTGEYLPANAIHFDGPAPFPTVYFTVTVIEGEYRKRIRRQRFAAGITAYTTGANMPSGYVHTFEGKSLNGTTVLRVLDPQVAGILTEFNVTIIDSRGLPCQQMCKHEAKNSYRPCPTDVVRLSTFAQYTDDIPTYQNSIEASRAAWLGQGYFRRRKSDYLVYKCRSEKRVRRRERKPHVVVQ